jgi:hypothetical protein
VPAIVGISWMTTTVAPHHRGVAVIESVDERLQRLQAELSVELTSELGRRVISQSSIRELCQHYHSLRFTTPPLHKATIPVTGATSPAAAAIATVTAPTTSSTTGNGVIPMATVASPHHGGHGDDHEHVLDDASLLSTPLFSASHRADVWRVLLGVHNKDDQRMAEWDRSLTLPNQSVIAMDCHRTRANDPSLQGSDRVRLEAILTFYCKSRGVTYKQGLNEVLCPLLVCMRSSSDSSLFNCLYALVAKFLPSIFADAQFESLRCLFRHFRILLSYHDPILAHYIEDEAAILPVSSFFLTFTVAFDHSVVSGFVQL